jgi:hypothetical protein
MTTIQGSFVFSDAPTFDDLPLEAKPQVGTAVELRDPKGLPLSLLSTRDIVWASPTVNATLEIVK